MRFMGWGYRELLDCPEDCLGAILEQMKEEARHGADD